MTRMSSDQGRIIARRSISLSMTYPIVGVCMALLGLLFASIAGIVGTLSENGTPVSSTGPSSVSVSASLPLLAVPLQAFSAILFATPVLLLFVYDKNNGVLEYFLSLGMTQGDIYRQYLGAALYLSSAIVCFDFIIDVVAGLAQGSVGTMFEVAALVVAIGLPVVSFQTLIMMSFSSLQKQRVGSNQPLGMAVGVFIVLPAYFFPLVFPSIASGIDLALAAAVVALSVVTYMVSGRLISREKLLP